MDNMANLVWAEKYRPTTIDECILPKDIKDRFKGFVREKHIPNLLLSGKSGVGKTTIAKALVNELGFEYIVINGSLNGGIDTLRNTIQDYVSTVSLSGAHKVVILDEADYLSAAMQPALRNFIESFSDICSFILTCNYRNKIIEPLQSRCATIEFAAQTEDKKSAMVEVTNAMEKMLAAEKIQTSKKIILHVVHKHFPDIRKVVNELQSYSAAHGTIDEGILTATSKTYSALVTSIQTKNFNEIRHWVGENISVDGPLAYREIYDKLSDVVPKTAFAQMIIILARYQYQHQFAADPEINLTACLVEIASECF